MNVSEAARRSGLPAKTIRYYEEVGLIRPAKRQDNRYRDYDETDVHRLRFVQRARGLGFSVEDCRQLLSLWHDDARTSAEVRRLAAGHLAGVRDRIARLRTMEETLERLVERCRGDAEPDCPILDDLARPSGSCHA